MPKKIAANPKAVEARERKAQNETEKKVKEQKDKEDAMWADEGKQSKAAKKKLEEEKKRQEAAAKKLEAKLLAEKEEKELEKISAKGAKGAGGKAGAGGAGAATRVTHAELARMKEEEAKKREEQEQERQKRASRVADVAEYEKMISVENTNRMEASVDARNLEEAVQQLSAVTLEEQTALDKHPEKRLRAAFKAFEEAELPRLRAERPGLTLTQYKEQIWKGWKKAPQNPLNQSPVKKP